MAEKKKSLGVDTSEHQQSKVDYKKFKDAGGEFAFLRVGYNTRIDKCFERDYAAAMASGLSVGVYFYTLATTVNDAEHDASRVLGWLNDRKLHLPVVYDVEDKRQEGSSRRFINSNIYNGFSNVVKDAGYDTMLYTGEYFFNAYFYKESVKDKLWIAKYSSKEPSVGRDVSIWQFTSAAVNTPYYKGDLDRNYMYGDVEPVIIGTTNKNYNPYPVPTRTLKRTVIMMHGNDVKWLQTELKRFGLIENGGVDGWFGNKTLAAVRIYQSQHGLVVDGIVGPATRYSLLHS